MAFAIDHPWFCMLSRNGRLAVEVWGSLDRLRRNLQNPPPDGLINDTLTEIVNISSRAKFSANQRLRAESRILMRFYFDFENGREAVRDNNGFEAVDLKQALANALDVVLEVAGEAAEKRPDDLWTLVVRDQTRAPVAYLPIRTDVAQDALAA